MKCAIKDHYSQTVSLQLALVAAGHELTDQPPVDVCLIDLDPDKIYGYSQLADFYADTGAVVIQYPHGAPASTLCYDSLYEPYERVDGQLTFGVGEAGLLERLDVKRPCRQMGWTLCPQLPFRPCERPRRVLFGPTHPNVEGNMLRERVGQNREVFRSLLKGPWEVTVRYVDTLDHNGLWEVPGVRYIQGLLDNSTAEIDAADVLVAGMGTLPTLAVARGCPTVVYGQFNGAEYGLPGETPTPLQRLSEYEDWVRYPADVEDGPLTDLIEGVTGGDPALVEKCGEWRDRWVGSQFDPEAFPSLLEEFVAELRSSKAALATTRGDA